jgi:hypothetical protein
MLYIEGLVYQAEFLTKLPGSITRPGLKKLNRAKGLVTRWFRAPAENDATPQI